MLPVFSSNDASDGRLTYAIFQSQCAVAHFAELIFLTNCQYLGLGQYRITVLRTTRHSLWV